MKETRSTISSQLTASAAPRISSANLLPTDLLSSSREECSATAWKTAGSIEAKRSIFSTIVASEVAAGTSMSRLVASSEGIEFTWLRSQPNSL
jgi:hypothetical protein